MGLSPSCGICCYLQVRMAFNCRTRSWGQRIACECEETSPPPSRGWVQNAYVCMLKRLLCTKHSTKGSMPAWSEHVIRNQTHPQPLLFKRV